MSEPDAVERANRATYRRPEVVRWYARSTGLQPAEAAVLDRHPDLLEGRVLDLGVGAGRTVPYLSARAREYVGVDLSPELVAAARTAHPDRDLRVGDARDLGEFATGSFDLVVFSFNGLDYLDLADRLRVLAEVRRVLGPGGHFLFSTHNRDHPRVGLRPWQGRPANIASLRRRAYALLHRRSRRRMEALEEHHESYSLLNDESHGYRLLTYFTSVEAQLRQLHEAGFTEVVVHDAAGEVVERDETSVWSYYLAA